MSERKKRMVSMPLLAESIVHHVTLEMPVGGEGQARRFYGEVLGLTEIPIPASLLEHEGESIWFALNILQQVHLGPVEDFHPQRRAHLALQVRDVPGVQALCQRSGVRLAQAEEEPGWLRYYAYDPFGNKLEFRQLLKDEA